MPRGGKRTGSGRKKKPKVKKVKPAVKKVIPAAKKIKPAKKKAANAQANCLCCFGVGILAGHQAAPRLPIRSH